MFYSYLHAPKQEKTLFGMRTLLLAAVRGTLLGGALLAFYRPIPLCSARSRPMPRVDSAPRMQYALLLLASLISQGASLPVASHSTEDITTQCSMEV